MLLPPFDYALKYKPVGDATGILSQPHFPGLNIRIEPDSSVNEFHDSDLEPGNGGISGPGY